MLAHLGVTDMKFPILFALNYPERVQYPMSRLDLTSLGALNFAAPDFDAFPCLGLARQAARAGGTLPAVLNAANEEAVAAFCRHALPFLGISEVVAHTLEHFSAEKVQSLEQVLEVDRAARDIACAKIKSIG
jgi:1-deoxy-D-xylulose-5-phosphate reductoisomerase